MEANTAALFNTTAEVAVKEIFSRHIVSIEPGCFCVLDEAYPSNCRHQHPYFELCLIVGGKGEFIHGEETMLLGEGDVFIANPGVRHEIRLLRDHNASYTGKLYLVFYIISITNISSNHLQTPNGYEEKMLDLFISKHSIIRKAQMQLFSYLYFIQNYVAYNGVNRTVFKQLVRNMAFEGLFLLVDAQETKDIDRSSANGAVGRAIKYIQSNIDKKMYVRDIAAYSCTSVRNLQYLFKKQLNTTVVDYLNEMKMSVASGYLKMNFAVSSVCTMVGIEDPSQFSRLFKKTQGISPKRYQMQYSQNHSI